ncbi:hypothetical protein BLA29_008790 [Euroglyphus maynei]|uniref:Uncharacterized protein n=1 Tax=Euroglyphus maynei TaxID=6958 RepID=A0A1Y3BQR3_EURMA|nr:hypothetical protein BLA29_008790 [Euroglyphus maynei]
MQDAMNVKSMHVIAVYLRKFFDEFIHDVFRPLQIMNNRTIFDIRKLKHPPKVLGRKPYGLDARIDGNNVAFGQNFRYTFNFMLD